MEGHPVLGWEVNLLSEDAVRVYHKNTPDALTVYRRGNAAEAEPAVPGWTLPPICSLRSPKSQTRYASPATASPNTLEPAISKPNVSAVASFCESSPMIRPS